MYWIEVSQTIPGHLVIRTNIPDATTGLNQLPLRGNVIKVPDAGRSWDAYLAWLDWPTRDFPVIVQALQDCANVENMLLGQAEGHNA
jgi:hypothetical protein